MKGSGLIFFIFINFLVGLVIIPDISHHDLQACLQEVSAYLKNVVLLLKYTFPIGL